MPKPNDLSVGAFADRAGVPVSTIHYYEAEGLIESWRTPANHRRYDRRELRRVAIARVAQSVGVAKLMVKAQEAFTFGRRERATVGPFGKIEHGVQVARFRLHHPSHPPARADGLLHRLRLPLA